MLFRSDVAIKTVWASVWNFRAFEERSYVGIDHLGVAMAVLANPSFGAEDANGVAITANIYEPVLGGVEAFFINAQVGEESVVEPAPGVTCDSLLYHYLYPNQPATYYAHSSIASPVLTREPGMHSSPPRSKRSCCTSVRQCRMSSGTDGCASTTPMALFASSTVP